MENTANTPQIINFSETGLIGDDTERSPISAGMRFTITKILFKDSAKYGTIATIDALTGADNDMELNLYTASKVLVTQLDKIQKKYGTSWGLPLDSYISVEVLGRISESSEQQYLSFV